MPQANGTMALPTPLIFGEVLFDCFPDGREVAGGAPFNVAWNLQALGLPPFFVSRVGDDLQGDRIALMMEDWAMNTAGLQVDPHLPTGRVDVTLAEGNPHFTILPSQAYDRIVFCLPDDLPAPGVLYHGSLALREQAGKKTLSRIKQHVSCPVFVDVNLRDPWWTKEQIYSLLEETTWLKLNEHELRTLFPASSNLKQSGKTVLERFNLDAIFITLGSSGALALTATGEEYAVAPPPSVPVIDTVGAGDAFASVLLYGLTLNWPLRLMMERGQDFATAVVGQRGAITTDRQFYSAIQKKWS